jgi:hypothetical protein
MKLIFILTILSISMGGWARRPDQASANKPFSEKLEAKRYYYSALNEFFKETYSKEIGPKDVSRMEHLLYYTGIEILDDYDPGMLARFPSSSSRFILGRNALQANNPTQALENFNRVHPDHRYYPESKLLTAHALGLLGKEKEQFEAIDQCRSSAEKHEGRAPGEKIKRYYRMIYEICLVNRARELFRKGDNKGALEAYAKVPKASYKWPYLLLEKAWVYYQMGDYNRVLGLLITYKSPLLDTYFFPEAEYLAALAYFRLCLYQDSAIIIQQYYQAYRPRFQALEGVLRKNLNSQNYFYNLMFKPGEDLKKHEEFVRHIITRLKKQTRFSLDFNTVYKVNHELKRVRAGEKGPILERLAGHLESVKENMVNKINYNAKADVFQFLQSVPFFSAELFKLNLETISKKKDLVYSNQKLISDRGRGDFSNVSRDKHEDFWKFHGAFWADELGDYSLGLKSSCQTVRKETREE